MADGTSTHTGSRRNWSLWWIICAFVLLITSSMAALREPPADEPVTSSILSLKWWLSPIERNGFLRLPATDANLLSVRFINARQGWAVSENGTILATNDGGKSWSRQSSGTDAELYSVQFINAQQGWVVGKSGIILVTNDGGKS